MAGDVPFEVLLTRTKFLAVSAVRVVGLGIVVLGAYGLFYPYLGANVGTGVVELLPEPPFQLASLFAHAVVIAVGLALTWWTTWTHRT